MNRARRWGVVAGAIVFLAAAGWWALHVPYRPEWLFRAVPAQATLVTRHVNLRDRWDRLYDNPLVLSLFMSAGVKPAALKEWAEDPEIRHWFDRLVGHDVVMAYLPPRTSHGDPTWVVVSWLGGDSQRLRWQIGWQRSKQFERRPPYHAHAYWRVRTPDIEPGVVLTVALVEGMIIGCLSDREEAMLDVLNTLDGLRPSVTRRAFQSDFTPAHMPAGVYDAAWLDADGMIGLRGASGQSVGVEFREISGTSLACRAYFPNARMPQASRTGPMDELARVLNDAPVWAVGFPLEWVMKTDGRGRPVWQEALWRVARSQQADSAVCALLGAPYAGRLAGIRLPSVVVALPLAQPDRAMDQMRAALDEINARSRWGLIPYPWAQVGDVPVVVIEGTSQNMYASLAPEEKPAFAVYGSWLLLAGQAAALKTLLEKAGETPRACWREVVSDTAPFWFWGDFRLGNDMLRLALSAYAFKLVLEDAAGTQRRRQRLNEWKAWLDALEPLEECAIRAEPWNASGLAFDVMMGKFCQ